MYQSGQLNTTKDYRKPDSGGVLALPPARFIKWHLAKHELALDKVRPVFVIANGRGYDTMVSDTLTLMPDANATLFTCPGCGHMDHFFAGDHFDIPE